MKPTGKKSRIFFIVGVGAVCLAAALAEASFGEILQDDAYISFRYAENLVAGKGLVYNAGERVEGYTNFLWTLLIAASVKAGVGAPFAGRWFGVAASLGAIILTAWIARRYANEYLGVVAAAMLAANGNFLLEAAQGLETALFVLVVTAAAWRAGEEFAAPAKRPLSVILLILAFLTRPDGALVFLAALPFYAATARANPRRFAVWLGTFALAAAAYESWRLAYYGSFFPNTFYAKVRPEGETLKYGLKYTVTFVLRFTPFFLLLPLAAKPRKVFYPWGALVAIFVTYVIIVGGDMKPSDRFYQPIIPLLLVAVAAALYDLKNAARWVPRWTLAALAGALVATSLLQFIPGLDYARQYRDPQRLHVAAGKWLGENASPGATLATTAAGIIPYYSGLYTIDMMGLTDPYVARHGRRTFTLPGHGLSATDYILDKKPDYILVYDLIFTAKPVSFEDLFKKMRWPAAYYMATSPRFRNEYVMSHAEITPGMYLVYFVRSEPSPKP
jgi:arabinofuranosyltransferase